MIDARNLSKSYGPVQALTDVSFHVKPGEIIGLLGPNGAGKTTIMKILTGYLQPSSGTATVDGFDVVGQPLEVQKRIGYLPENAPLYPELSVQAYLKMIADLRLVPDAEQPANLSEAIRAAGLQDHLTRSIGHLSKGYRQRVGLAQAIVHKPQLLILDEPTVGLDPTQIVEVRNLIRRLARHTTVLLSTHILSEVEAMCDGVIILMNGEIKADSQLSDLEASSGVVLILQDDVPEAASSLRALPGVNSVESLSTADGPGYLIQAADNVDLRPAVYDLARNRDWPLKELRRDVRTLEMVFNELATAAQDRPSPNPTEDRPGSGAPAGKGKGYARRSSVGEGGES
jgi:ABC-2 type transport system ATP-binding protein